MNKRVMETMDKHTQGYLQGMLDNDRHARTWAMATICAAWKYFDDMDIFAFTHDVHMALLDLELSHGIYTLVHKSDIIIESNGGENGKV